MKFCVQSYHKRTYKFCMKYCVDLHVCNMVTVRIIKIMSDDKFNAVEIYRLLIGNYAQKSAIKFYKLLIYNPYLRHRIE